MSLIIQNLSDGSSQTIATGGLGFLTLQAGDPTAAGESRGLLAQWDHAVWEKEWVSLTSLERPEQASAYVSGALAASVSPFDAPQGDYLATSGQYNHQTPSAFIYLSVPQPGVFYITVVVTGNEGAEYCGLLVRALPLFNLPMWPALAWVPANLIDLQVDVNARTVNSAVLGHCAGLKQGDDFALAVVPMRAGTLIISGITAMSLTLIDRANSPYAPLTFVATGSPPTLTEIGGDPTHQYYTIGGNLRDAQIAAWFQDLNKRIDALATTPGTALPDRSRLEAFAQLHVTTADGITTTQNFPFPVLANAEVLSSIGTAAATTDPGVELVWDFSTNNVIAQTSATLNLTPAADGVSIINVKEQDDLIVRLRLVKNGSALAPTVTACKLVLKELDQAGQIVISDAFTTSGAGDNFSLLIHAQLTGAPLTGALSDYAAAAYDADSDISTQKTTFPALAEIELTYTNPFGFGPGTLVKTSKTFRIQIDRDLGEVA